MRVAPQPPGKRGPGKRLLVRFAQSLTQAVRGPGLSRIIQQPRLGPPRGWRVDPFGSRKSLRDAHRDPLPIDFAAPRTAPQPGRPSNVRADAAESASNRRHSRADSLADCRADSLTRALDRAAPQLCEGVVRGLEASSRIRVASGGPDRADVAGAWFWVGRRVTPRGFASHRRPGEADEGRMRRADDGCSSSQRYRLRSPFCRPASRRGAPTPSFPWPSIPRARPWRVARNQRSRPSTHHPAHCRGRTEFRQILVQ